MDASDAVPYPAWVAQEVAAFRERNAHATFRTMPSATLLEHPPGNAPKVGRYPMRDHATLLLRLGPNPWMEVDTMSALVSPELAIVPWKRGWLAVLRCVVSGYAIAGAWQPVDMEGFRKRLVEGKGSLNVIVRLPGGYGRVPLRGARRDVTTLWLPSVDPLKAGRRLKSVRAHRTDLGTAAKSESQAAPASIRVVAKLADAPFPVSRTVAMSPDTTLDQLAHALMRAFGWDGSHLWGFGSGRSYFDESASGSTTLEMLHGRRVRNLFWRYDFGDNWHHDLKLRLGKEEIPPDEAFVLVESEGPTMVDDIGGVWALADYFGSGKA